MSLPDEPAPLSPWPFLIADAVALGTAFVIGEQAHAPYSAATVISIGALVAVGASVTVLPFILNHARKQDLLLAERQREIAALTQTVRECAEQLSIAAGSLHGIADSAAKSVKQAEQLPIKLQEKIHEFKEQLHEVSATENEALSQEVNTLRSAETERIESVVTTVRKLSGEFARLEAASRKHVTDLSDALTRFTKSSEQAAEEATTAIASLRAGSEKSLVEAQSSAVRAIEDSVQRGLAEFDAKLALFSGRLSVQLENATNRLGTPAAPGSRAGNTGVAVSNGLDESPRASALPHPIDSGSVETARPSEQVDTPHLARRNASAAPFASQSARGVEVGELEPKAPRKKAPAPQRVDATDEFNLGLSDADPKLSDEFSQADPDSSGVAAVSHDGLTRLVVTAYIGIGNKLFARGEGPGLSWEQGVPLHFVSIGKWRWESAEAESAVKIKLFKNDEQECAALGEVTLESGHQREVTATF